MIGPTPLPFVEPHGSSLARFGHNWPNLLSNRKPSSVGLLQGSNRRPGSSNRRAVGPPPGMDRRNNGPYQHATGVGTTPVAYSVQPSKQRLSPVTGSRRNNGCLTALATGVETTPVALSPKVSEQHLRTSPFADVETTSALSQSVRRNNGRTSTPRLSEQQSGLTVARWTSPVGYGPAYKQSIPSSVGISRQCGPSRTFKRAGRPGPSIIAPPSLHARAVLLGQPCAAAVAAVVHGPVAGSLQVIVGSLGSSSRRRRDLCQISPLSNPREARPCSGPCPGPAPWATAVAHWRNPNRIPRCTDSAVGSHYGRFADYGKPSRTG